MADGVRGGILDFVPLKGAKFVHRDWEIVDTCIPRDMNRQAMRNAMWALSCIQSDLRHRVARVAGTTFLDGRCHVRFQDVIRCDEGGWVKIDDLIRMEVLWNHNTREITDGALCNEDQRKGYTTRG